ncbi:MAG TPA: helix-turn-helix transcriptional regulator [Acidimicrobiales bacterium]
MTEPDARMEDLGAFIREHRNNVQLSLRKLSEAAGISNPYLSQIERGLRKPSAEILRQLANALHISAETLYVRAGILDEKPEGPDVVGGIERDPFLTEDQRRTLIRVYHGFRAENGNVDKPAAAADDAVDADDAA